MFAHQFTIHTAGGWLPPTELPRLWTVFGGCGWRVSLIAKLPAYAPRGDELDAAEI